MPRIKVAIRIKPENGERLKGFSHQMREADKAKIELFASGTKNDFNFDNLFDEDASQEDIFNTCCVPIISNVLDGQNGTLFAYGQTGAGKTHTITGPETEEFAERGLCMRSADYIFRKIRTIKDTAFTVKFSVIEIYNDSVLDLLRENLKDSPKLVIVDTPDGVVVPSLYLLPLENEEEAYTKLVEANINRSVAAHQLNRRSSRSHVIYSFYIMRSRISANGADGSDASDVLQSKLHLVDLAGSERIEKTGSKGGVAKEATHINKSLSFLEQVVLALTKQTQQGGVGLGVGGAGGGTGTLRRDTVVAYRQSKLTYILKDSLGGNCNTVLIACVWPHENHLWETLSTLRFATRMRCIENHPHRNALVTGNGANSSTRTLVLKIESLKKELALRDMMYDYGVTGPGPGEGSKGQTIGMTSGHQSFQKMGATSAGGMTKNQLKRSMQMTQDFVKTNTDSDTVDVKSLAEVTAIAKALRSAIWLACGQDEQRVMEIMHEVCGAGVSGAGNDRGDHEGDGEELVPSPPRNHPAHSQSPRGDCRKSITAAIAEEGNSVEDGQGGLCKEPDGSYKEEVDSGGGVAYVGEQSPSPNPNHDRSAVSTDIIMDQQDVDDGRAPSDEGPFDHFKQNEGLEHHNFYEGVKLRLKEAKALQRTLVKVVNEYKAKIDVKTDVVSQIAGIASAGEEEVEAAGGLEQVARDLKDAQGELARWKSEYKTSRSELLKCKEGIADLTVQKQRALNILVKSFEEYSN